MLEYLMLSDYHLIRQLICRLAPVLISSSHKLWAYEDRQCQIKRRLCHLFKKNVHDQVGRTDKFFEIVDLLVALVAHCYFCLTCRWWWFQSLGRHPQICFDVLDRFSIKRLKLNIKIPLGWSEKKKFCEPILKRQVNTIFPRKKSFYVIVF